MGIKRIFEMSEMYPTNTWRPHHETVSALALHRCEELKFSKYYIWFLRETVELKNQTPSPSPASREYGIPCKY